MPDEKTTDDVEKVLAELKTVEDRKQAVIEDLLRQREAAINAFDEKLAKLGYRATSVKPKRNHHKKTADAPGAARRAKNESQGLRAGQCCQALALFPRYRRGD